MPALYGPYEFKPAQSVTLSSPKNTTGDGRVVGQTVRAVLAASIVPCNPAGTFTPVDPLALMSTILQKQAEIRAAVAQDGLTFEVMGWDSNPPVKFPARVVDLQFQEGPWTNECKYSITFEGMAFAGETSPGYNIESASESWNFSADSWPNHANHTVQAKGKLIYDASGVLTKPAWQYARDFVTGQLALGWTNVGGVLSPQSGQQILAGGQVQPAASGAWNRTLTEDINELDGTYSATEGWLLLDQSYYEETTYQVRKLDDQPNLTVEVSLSGTITGYAANLNDYAGRYASALSAWSTIQPGLQARAATAAGTTLNTHPVTFNVTKTPVPGTVNYECTYNNRVLVGDAFETWNVSEKRSIEEYATTVTVEGTITGMLYLDTDTDPSVRITRARARWIAVQGLLYARAVTATGLTDLKLFPLAQQYGEDSTRGTVTYSIEFDNRPSDTARCEFTVSRKDARDDPKNTVTIEGTVTGLLGDATSIFDADYETRYDNARAYFEGIEPNLCGLAAIYVSTADINPEVWAKSVSHNPKAGTVNFHYEFTTQRRMFPFALSEVFSMTDEDSVPVIATIPIPGRAGGPIIQDMNTVTEKKRTLNIELVLPMPQSTGYYDPPAIDVNQFKPSGAIVKQTANQKHWLWNTGHYTITSSWISTS